MTIHELEKRIGIPRASIRFYEKEGLISPKRLPNGYRDYSEEDARTLEKIALLRRMDFSLEYIRQVQSGVLPLVLALENQRENLLEQRVEKEKALFLCDVLRQEGASYSTLEPEKYENHLPPPAAPEFRQLPQPEWEPATAFTWRRFFAYILDYALYLLPLELLGRANLLEGTVLTVLKWLMYLLAMAVIEPILLSTWGTTPGKWLQDLRLRVTDESGQRKLTYREAVRRTVKRGIYGDGLSLPVLSAAARISSYFRSMNGKPQPWDDIADYTVLTPRSKSSSGGFVAAMAAILLAHLLVYNAAAFPKVERRETFTPELYAQTVNDYLVRRMDITCLTLQHDGSWQHTCQDSCPWDAFTRHQVQYTLDNGEIRRLHITSTYLYDTVVDVLLACRICPEKDNGILDEWSLKRELNRERGTEYYRSTGIFEVKYGYWYICWDKSTLTMSSD